ncbi:MAG TPA: cytidine deaminase [Bacilli bacterium]|nr:cytidine deaminase [Acholeplasmataceae bacterium]HNZ77671.1 cytidine deaminase [Bacilli bacterium]HOD60702.1 cytidine deaminase [Bacilli bacterium]HOE07027.1 cytidine deaminase [Bacilli bacterium]HOH61812.1 cytidine deaminase [Bacilli bacterium]
MDKITEQLYQAALKAYQNAYTPYSKFNVGAAVLLKDGKIIAGSNVENASYGLSNCAERTTLFYTYSQGYRQEDISKFLVLANTKKPVSPCGACRQVMAELLNEDVEIILTNLNQDIMKVRITDLLPYHFSGDNLRE